jgi:hypothetical protein
VNAISWPVGLQNGAVSRPDDDVILCGLLPSAFATQISVLPFC